MPKPRRLSTAASGSLSSGSTPAAAYACPPLPPPSTGAALAVLNVRQAAIASATPGGVRAGHSGPSPATTSTRDPSHGTVDFFCFAFWHCVGRACPAVAPRPLGAVHGDKGRLQRLVSGHERGRNQPW